MSISPACAQLITTMRTAWHARNVIDYLAKTCTCYCQRCMFITPFLPSCALVLIVNLFDVIYKFILQLAAVAMIIAIKSINTAWECWLDKTITSDVDRNTKNKAILNTVCVSD